MCDTFRYTVNRELKGQSRKMKIKACLTDLSKVFNCSWFILFSGKTGVWYSALCWANQGLILFKYWNNLAWHLARCYAHPSSSSSTEKQAKGLEFAIRHDWVKAFSQLSFLQALDIFQSCSSEGKGNGYSLQSVTDYSTGTVNYFISIIRNYPAQTILIWKMLTFPYNLQPQCILLYPWNMNNIPLLFAYALITNYHLSFICSAP